MYRIEQRNNPTIPVQFWSGYTRVDRTLLNGLVLGINADVILEGVRSLSQRESAEVS